MVGGDNKPDVTIYSPLFIQKKQNFTSHARFIYTTNKKLRYSLKLNVLIIQSTQQKVQTLQQ
jgi:hypothetical protein